MNDPRLWSDKQILEFLGTALRNVDLRGSIKLGEIRQGFEVVMGRIEDQPKTVDAPQTVVADRSTFETIITARSLERYDSGRYVDPFVEGAWFCWQKGVSTPMPVALPPRFEMEPYQTVDAGSTNYKAGWNRCINAIKAGNPALKFSEGQGNQATCQDEQCPICEAYGVVELRIKHCMRCESDFAGAEEMEANKRAVIATRAALANSSNKPT